MKLYPEKLIDARHRKGLTQQQVADGSEVSLMTICNAENGKSILPGTGKAICNFLGLDLGAMVIPMAEQEENEIAR